MILLDTSALVAGIARYTLSTNRLRELLQQGETLAVSSIVLYEWWRGPRSPEELLVQEQVFPREQSLPFTAIEADLAARLYRQLPRARSREVDVAIAATAIVYDATLWTLNRSDFADIPGLLLL
jgi:predicted nucleic acid-binding protein